MEIMEIDVFLFLSVLCAMVAFFLSGKVAVDLVALSGLALLIILNLLSPADAFKGFSSPAVITLGSMFIIAAGLKRSGFADQIAAWIIKFFGRSEAYLIAAIMLLCGSISFFVNNIAVVALLMPTVISISHKTSVPPSKLLIPLSFSAVLGGTGTLIGTTPNILMIDVMESLGNKPFSFFDFSPFGVSMLLLGTLFMAGIGRHFLPRIDVGRQGKSSRREKLSELYKLDDRVFSVMIPINSNLHGKTLRELRFAEVLGVQVITIRRQGKIIQAPRGGVVLRALDVLTVGGLQENLERILDLKGIKRSQFKEGLTSQLHKRIVGAKLEILKGDWVGKPVRSMHYMERYGLAITGIERDGSLPVNFLDVGMKEGDLIHVIGTPSVLETTCIGIGPFI